LLILLLCCPTSIIRVVLGKGEGMKGATLADAAINSTDQLYEVIEALRAKNQNLQTENQLLKVLLGK